MIKELTSYSIKAGNLKRLYLGARLNESTDGPVTDEYPTSNTVEELSLASSHVRDKRAIDIVNLYPNVRRLDMSNTKVTGVAVKHFVSMGIKWLKLDECSEISPDAVEYARGKGVEVEYNFPSRRFLGFKDKLASAF
jgi:F-box/TPR repeat protein Pof3